MRALVTGANGFIGHPLVDSLVKDGIQVRVLARTSHALPAVWKNRVEVAIGDLTSAFTVAPATADCEVVYHLAGEIRNPSTMWAVNKEGTECLLEASQEAGVKRFLYLSSVGVVGFRGDLGHVDESTAPQPRNLYERTKYAGETAALRYHKERGMHVKSLRPSIVYGEGRNPREDSFLAWVRSVGSGCFVLLGNDYVNSYVYVGDVVAACRFVEQSPGTGGESYIVNDVMSLNLFVGEMARQLGVKMPWVLPDAVGGLAVGLLRLTGRFGSLYNRTIFSMDKLNRLGFTPPYGYQIGLHRTLDWYRSKGYLG